jgi:hypothetical protein
MKHYLQKLLLLLTGLSMHVAHGQVSVLPSTTITSCDGIAYYNQAMLSAPWTYEWMQGSTLLLADTSSISGLCPGNYSLVLDSAGIDMQVVTFNISTASLDASVNITRHITGGPCNGSASVNVYGGSGPYAFAWSDGSTVPTMTNMCPGPYSVTVVDMMGDTAIVNFEAGAIYDEHPIVEPTLWPLNEFTCDAGAEFVYGVSFPAEFTYRWMQGNTLLQAGGTTIDSLCVGTYMLIVDSADVEIAHDAFAVISHELCGSMNSSVSYVHPGAENSGDGYMTFSSTGGSGNYTYFWWLEEDSVATHGVGSGSTFLVQGLNPGTYQFLSFDENGCYGGGLIQLYPGGVDPSFHYVGLTVVDEILCAGTATLVMAGGVLPYTYVLDSDTISNVLTGLCPGFYTIRAYDAANDSIEIDFQIFATTPVDTCNGFTATHTTTPLSAANSNDGGFTLSASGGTAPYGFVWTSAADSLNSTPGDTAGGLGAGHYIYVATDSTGCTVSDTLYVSTVITVDFQTTNDSLIGSCSGTVTATVSGGLAPYILYWSTATAPDNETYTLTDLCPGIYELYVFDAQGDSTIATFTIMDPATIYGNLPFGDSLVMDTLYGDLVENCFIDYSEVTNAFLNDVTFDPVTQQLIVNWAIYSPSGVIYITDSLPFTGQAGVYNVVISAYCPGKSTGNYLQIQGQVYFDGNTIGVAGLGDNGALTDVQVSPNPFGESFLIQLPVKGQYKLALMDATGRTVYETQVQDKNQFVVQPDQTLAPGSYFLKIAQNGQSVVLKLVH